MNLCIIFFPTLTFLLFVTSAASAPIIKSFIPDGLNPVPWIGFVLPNVSIYNPTLENHKLF